MIITTLVEMLIIWLPALVSILGIVGTVVGAIAKTKSAIAEIKDSTELRDATAEMKRLATENQELIRTQKLLLDNITRIQNYADEETKK
jgi:hypothetical protein